MPISEKHTDLAGLISLAVLTGSRGLKCLNSHKSSAFFSRNAAELTSWNLVFTVKQAM
jgi:hypothetical protein